VLREKAESSMKQLKEIQDMQKNMKQDRDFIKQEKAILEEKVLKQGEELVMLKDQLNATYKH
jgi:hypothetical protein